MKDSGKLPAQSSGDAEGWGSVFAAKQLQPSTSILLPSHYNSSSRLMHMLHVIFIGEYYMRIL